VDRQTSPGLPAEYGRAAGPRVPAGPGAIIGDQLRKPLVWCELPPCISWHADPRSLGEADARARAASAGWQRDAFGRLACPACQQRSPQFRATHAVVPWDRATAMVMAGLVAQHAAASDANAGTQVLALRPPGPPERGPDGRGPDATVPGARAGRHRRRR